MIRRLNKSLPVVLWAFLIFLGSSLPSAKASDNGVVDFAAHKLVHIVEYGVLYLLYYRSVAGNFWDQKIEKVLQSLLFIVLYGAFDEYHQSFVPGRSSRVRDVFVDLLGGVLAYLLWWYLKQKPLWKHKN